MLARRRQVREQDTAGRVRGQIGGRAGRSGCRRHRRRADQRRAGQQAQEDDPHRAERSRGLSRSPLQREADQQVPDRASQLAPVSNGISTQSPSTTGSDVASGALRSARLDAVASASWFRLSRDRAACPERSPSRERLHAALGQPGHGLAQGSSRGSSRATASAGPPDGSATASAAEAPSPAITNTPSPASGTSTICASGLERVSPSRSYPLSSSASASSSNGWPVRIALRVPSVAPDVAAPVIAVPVEGLGHRDRQRRIGRAALARSPTRQPPLPGSSGLRRRRRASPDAVHRAAGCRDPRRRRGQRRGARRRAARLVGVRQRPRVAAVRRAVGGPGSETCPRPRSRHALASGRPSRPWVARAARSRE